MNNLKIELMITENLELTQFGGLVKVRIPKQIKSGLLTDLDSPYLLTTQYLTPRLKVYRKVRRFEEYTGRGYDNIEWFPISNYKIRGAIEYEYVPWRTTIWNISIFRSLEIWKRIPTKRIFDSIGVLTIYGKRSINGKLGNANNKYFEKDENGNWIFIQWKNYKNDKFFTPLTEEAILKCKERARKK